MEDDFEDECIMVSVSTKNETYHLESFKDSNRRITFRLAYAIVGELWCDKNLPHVVVIPASSIGATYCVPDLVCDWVGENLRGMWSIGNRQNDEFVFNFELARDAMLFKLRWS